jgi:hypothetical protein
MGGRRDRAHRRGRDGRATLAVVKSPLVPLAAVALSLQTAGAFGCASYAELPLTDPTVAIPQRPEVSPPAENGVGVIAGEVRVESLAASVSVAFETVGLLQDGKLLATSSTDGHGRFRFEKTGPGMYDDGFYELTLLSDRYRGSSHIQYARFAKRSYELRVEPRKGP